METFNDIRKENINDVIYTDNFKKWFGDWEKRPQTASKVVDSNGLPLVVYHGSTSKGITSFKPSEGSSNFGEYKFGDVEVSYFSGDIDIAKGYTWSHKNSQFGDVYDCYLRILHPFVMDAEGESALSIKKNKFIRELEKEVLDKIIWRYSDDEEDDDLAYSPELSDLNEELFFLDYKLEDKGDYIDLVRLGKNNSMFSGAESIAYTDKGENVMRAVFSSMDGEDGMLGEVLSYDLSEYETISTDGIVRLLLYYNNTINRLNPYDGAIIKNVFDSAEMFGGESNDYIVFHSSSIKSASKNNGDFGFNDNIYEKEE